MTSRARRVVWIIGIFLVCLTTAVLFFVPRRPPAPKLVSVTGVILAEDPDPKKQVAIANANVTAGIGQRMFTAHSDLAGLFRFSFPVPPKEDSAVSLRFQAGGYQSLLLSSVTPGQLLVARLLPEREASSRGSAQTIGVIVSDSVSVRYTTKMTTATNVGALVKTFEAANTGGVPCDGGPVCSPDRKWRATVSPVVFEAATGNQFLNARVSCIAGPCPFTRMEADNLADPGSAIRVSIRNWSDTATFLVEAEVSRIIHGDMVRQSIPAIFGPAFSFTLPPGGEGPSIQAEVNGTSIVFPLGPEHRLSWANCNVQIIPGGTQAFRCELKPGYQFR